MTEDPIVREVRKARAELSERCGHDLRRFGEMMRERQRSGEGSYVAPPRKTAKGHESV